MHKMAFAKRKTTAANGIAWKQAKEKDRSGKSERDVEKIEFSWPNRKFIMAILK